MIGRILKTTFLLLASGIILGCKAPPLPPEVKQAALQELNLWKSGAEVYAREEYRLYKISFRNAREELVRENSRFIWFRDYEGIRLLFSDVLETGRSIEKVILERKDSKERELQGKLLYFEDRIRSLKNLTTLINEGRFSRGSLTKAEILLSEAQRQKDRGQYERAERTLKRISAYTASAVDTINPILNRFTSREQIDRWKSLVNETIRESRKKGIYSIVVSKLDRKLILYKRGDPYLHFTVGIGLNGSSDKLHAGDRATPEGKYHITKKKSASHFHKALLINYPNDQDRKRFSTAKKKGLIPPSAGIGGLIEIHGGGKEATTLGCVSMENAHIDRLFSLVDIGTPVTIVGALQYDNIISSALEEL